MHAVHRHRTSCALSNFPDEHKPSVDYITEVAQAIGARWHDFAMTVNGYLLGD